MSEYSKLADDLAEKTPSRILLAVIDGLGDLPVDSLRGRTPLEAASTPNLDSMVMSGALGSHVPIAPGITPGSGPAHLALFGYDPLEFEVGRGVLAALGVGFDLKRGDLAARINFCTVDAGGTVTDRRAGRIDTATCVHLVSILSSIRIDGLELFVMPVKEHRACVVFRGEGLDDRLHDTDPGLTGRRPVEVIGDSVTARAVREFVSKASGLLADSAPANHVLLRGFALFGDFPSMRDRFGLDPAAVALYPMYRGVARLVGMRTVPVEPADLDGQVKAAAMAASSGADLVFLHHKPADSSGEDGNVQGKIEAIEAFDTIVPGLAASGFDVICVTGDHSTPCPMKLHSWHPVPLLVHGGPQRTGWSRVFSEHEACTGAIGRIRAVELMPLLLASAGKLQKFGA